MKHVIVVCFVLMGHLSIGQSVGVEGSYVPLFLINHSGIICLDRLRDPWTLLIEAGKINIGACNDIKLTYSIISDCLEISPPIESEHIHCEGLSGQIEDFFSKTDYFEFTLVNDSLIIEKGVQKLTLVKESFFNGLNYDNIFFLNACEWQYKKSSESGLFIGSEPVYITPEEFPFLCSGLDLSSHVKAIDLSFLKGYNISKVVLRLIINKNGSLESLELINSNFHSKSKKSIELNIKKQISLLGNWEPGKIDNVPVISMFPIVLFVDKN